MFTLLVFIATLAVLVLAHEWGHFWVARKAGVRVDEFGFGFPPRIVGVYKDPQTGKFKAVGPRNLKKDDDAQTPEQEHQRYHAFPATVYSLNLLPLGGFVKIKGEDGEHKGDKDSFATKKPWVRSLILSAGVIMNVLVAVVLLSVGFGIGIPTALGDELPAGAVVSDQKVSILEVVPGSPAEQAGVLPGDVLVGVNRDVFEDSTAAFELIKTAAAESEVLLWVLRGEEKKEFALTPQLIEEIGRPAVGVALIDSGLVKLPWHRAFIEGTLSAFVMLWQIIVAFAGIFKGLFAGEPVAEQLSGPVGIAVLTGQVARLGFSYMLQFISILSLNLALLNILPIPALDGGRLLFVAIEKIRGGKKVSKKVEQYFHAAGFALLLLLVIVVTARDIGRYF